jgi:hypothetical protein
MEGKSMAGKKPKKLNHTPGTRGGSATERRAYFRQADFPQTTLQQAQKIPSALVDNFAGKEGSPPDIALSIGVSPTSNGWRDMAGSSVAYGLTEGGFNASAIRLTALGRATVAPENEGDDLAARRQAIMNPRISKQFFERYRRAKFPNDTIGGNVLSTLGLPKERVQSALEIVKANGRYAGIIRDSPTGPFVNLDSPGVPAPTATPALPAHDAEEDNVGAAEEAVGITGESSAAPAPRRLTGVSPPPRRQDQSCVYLPWQAEGHRHPAQGTAFVRQL